MGIFGFLKKKKKEDAKPAYTFSDWNILITEVVESGTGTVPFDRIIEQFPDDYIPEYGPLLADAVEKLETYALKKAINRFNRMWNKGIMDNDITCVKRAWKSFQDSLNDCLFFRSCESFPDDIAEQVENQVKDAADGIQSVCEKFIRQAENESGSLLMKDIYYMIRKEKLQIR